MKLIIFVIVALLSFNSYAQNPKIGTEGLDRIELNGISYVRVRFDLVIRDVTLTSKIAATAAIALGVSNVALINSKVPRSGFFNVSEQYKGRDDEIFVTVKSRSHAIRVDPKNMELVLDTALATVHVCLTCEPDEVEAETKEPLQYDLGIDI